jgi:hypothetical protein
VSKTYQRLTYPEAPELLERLSAAFHEVYQREARRQAEQNADTVRHLDSYDALLEHTKDYDRALAIFVLDAIGEARAFWMLERSRA